MIAKHQEAAARGEPFLERTLAIGAGDCDVQNAVLLRLLHEVGVPARLAIGYLGRGGEAAPWLHAWIEYRTDDGPWRVADVSDGAPPFRAFTAAEEVAEARGSAAPAAEAAPAPAAAVTGPARAARDRRTPLALALACGAAGVALLATGVVATRTRRSIALDRGHDLARLLQGAIQQPGAFQHVPSLFHRRLLPCIGGRPATLAEAWALSAKGRLYAATSRRGLALDVARARGRVIDRTTKEGAAVAESLGAVDLDLWEALLAGAAGVPLVEALNATLARQRERWRVRVVHGIRPSPSVLELPGRLRRVVAVDARDPVLEDAVRLAEAAPARALYDLAEALAAAIDLPADRRARILGPLARAALFETVERDERKGGGA